MQVERQETVCGLDIIFRELTVAEIREWMAGGAVEGAPQDVVGTLLFDDFDLADITLLTNLSTDQLDGLAPSEVDEVFARCRAYNARFFVMRDRLEKIIKSNQASPLKTS